MSKVEIIPVSNKKDEKIFIDIPWRIYDRKEHTQWVPPLRMNTQRAIDTKNNPFYKNAKLKMFLAKKNDKYVGRIAGIKNNSYNDFHSDKTGFYGFFECINDTEVSNALFKAVEEWLKSQGLEKMQGPVNPSTNHECGLLVRGQSQHPTVMTTWNPRYYVDLHEEAKLDKAKDLVAYALVSDAISELPARVVEHAEQKRKDSGLTFRDFDVKNFDRDVKICFDIYNSSWEKNWGFFPMSEEEFIYEAKDMKHVLDPRFAFIAEKNGEPAGFMLGIPDINHILKHVPNGRLFPTGALKLMLGKKFLTAIRIVALGVKEKFRGEGIFQLFTHESYTRAQKYNFKFGEASWILEDNEGMNKPWQELGAPVYRRWRIYERSLQ